MLGHLIPVLSFQKLATDGQTDDKKDREDNVPLKKTVNRRTGQLTFK